jgi:hypothetical protein
MTSSTQSANTFKFLPRDVDRGEDVVNARFENLSASTSAETVATQSHL